MKKTPGATNANWWDSGLVIARSMVGPGVLTLPSAMSKLGWVPGVAIFIISGTLALYTSWQTIEMHEMVSGKRFGSYGEIFQHAFGENLGVYIVLQLQQLMVEVGAGTVYMVTGGKSLMKLYDLICNDDYCKNNKLMYFIMVFCFVSFLISLLPDFLIRFRGLATIAIFFSYCTITWLVSLKRGSQPGIQYGYKANSTSGNMFNSFTALGDVAFAYAHSSLLEIQATIPTTAENPSKDPMWNGVIAAYVVAGLCYLPVAFVGYWVFGNGVSDDIVTILEKPTWAIAIANLLVVFHVTGSYQLHAKPVCDLIETILVNKFKFTPSFLLRFITRAIFAAITMVLGICFPYLDGLLAFIGGFAFASSAYIFPCILWLRIENPKKWSFYWMINWVCIILGVALMVVSLIGALRHVIVSKIP